MSPPAATDAPRTAADARRGGLFLRIYLTFILTVVAFAALVALAVLTLASPYDAAWVETVEAAVTAREPALTQHLADPDALTREVSALADELRPLSAQSDATI